MRGRLGYRCRHQSNLHKSNLSSANLRATVLNDANFVGATLIALLPVGRSTKSRKPRGTRHPHHRTLHEGAGRAPEGVDGRRLGVMLAG
jgi:hypothetical protein